MLDDPNLRGVSALIFDEFHERHLYGDITLARALEIQESSRPDLKILVMSATLESESLGKYLHPCVSLRSEGRTFPVTMEYLDKPYDPDRYPVWQLVADELTRLEHHHTGDVLIFMPGAYEIQRTISALQNTLSSHAWIILPLHGELPPDQQDAAVARYEKRKVVVTTNVAETSLTIDGVRLVIDSGLARVAKYDPYRGINTLLIEKISRASSDQRAGRAGRTAPGHCLRLWTQREPEARAPELLPQNKRLDLAETLLTLKASGVRNLRTFRWLEPPDPRSFDRAEQLLFDLGAIDPSTQQLTAVGRKMANFPMHPRYARMLLAAHELGCVRPVALIAALTQGRAILLPQVDKKTQELRDDLLGGENQSDFFLLMRAWRYAERSGFDIQKCRALGIHAQAARQVTPILQSFLRLAEAQRLDTTERPSASEAIQRCIVVGFSDHLGRRIDGGTLRCDLVHKRRGVLARDSAVTEAKLVVAAEIREIQGKDRELNTLLTLATAVQPEWLQELFPGDFSASEEVIYDENRKKVIRKKLTLFRDLVLEEVTDENPPLDAAAQVLTQRVLNGSSPLHHWDDAIEQWIVRLNCLAEWMPDLQLPPLSTEARQTLIEQLCHGATSYREIKDRDVWPVVKSWLSSVQQEWIDQYAPERFALPGGRKAKITYAPGQAPVLAARIQDLYGVSGDLRIAAGKIPLVVQILAPNHRPIQITQNLANFWKESYPTIKLELQRKYPKHEWR
jgi:ATP-dependent helicase HrpB